MKTITALLIAALFTTADDTVAQEEVNLSLKLEIQRSIDRGLKWLRDHQDGASGHWGDETQPALTALAVSAMMADPSRKPGDLAPPHVQLAYDFIESSRKDDGGIYGKGLACYNTSLCLMALLQEETGKYQQLALGARRFLINQQSDFDIKGETDNPYDGGVGYGGTYAHSDLSNTHFVLEALHYSKALFVEKNVDESKQLNLNWDAAIKFVERCQNNPATNDQAWASDDPKNKGGFVYFPGDSKAGDVKLDNGKVALRSYGSMSYAGLLSLIYADLKPGDPRVEAVLQWLRENYALDENPGLGQQGLYYYYHSMAKALTLANVNQLESNGKKIDWREELAKKLFNLQSADGSWANDNGRWWEKDPVLVTSYAVLTLEHIYHGL